MNNYLTIRKLQQPYTKHVMEIGVAGDGTLIDTVSQAFSKACEIVDAQFYYTSPLLFIFLDDVPQDAAKLYDTYYLLPPKLYDSLDIDTSHLAVNQVFLKHICSLTHLSEDASVKGERKELQAPEDSNAGVMDGLFELYQEYGLYIIGVLMEEHSGIPETQEEA